MTTTHEAFRPLSAGNRSPRSLVGEEGAGGLELGRGQERGGRASMQTRTDGLYDEGDDLAPLLPERRLRGEDALDEATPPRALSAEGAVPQKDAVAEDALGRVVRGLDALEVNEGPQRLLVIEEVLAGARDLLDPVRVPLLQAGEDSPPEWRHELLELGPGERAVAGLRTVLEPMPPLEEEVDLDEEGTAELPDFRPVMFEPLLELPLEMRFIRRAG